MGLRLKMRTRRPERLGVGAVAVPCTIVAAASSQDCNSLAARGV